MTAIVVADNTIAPKYEPFKAQEMTGQVIQGNSYLPARNVVYGTKWAFIEVYSRGVVVDSVLSQNGVNMEDLLYKLGMCESGLNPTKCVVDTNGLLSCGLFQYQRKTWETFCSGNIYDPEAQIRCATKMIGMGLGHTTVGWFNCWRKLNLPKII